MGEILKVELERLKLKHACIGDVRSIGLFASIEMVKNKKTKEPLVPYNAAGQAAKVANRLKESGIEQENLERKEIIALIANLQRLGTDIKPMPQATN